MALVRLVWSDLFRLIQRCVYLMVSGEDGISYKYKPKIKELHTNILKINKKKGRWNLPNLSIALEQCTKKISTVLHFNF